MTSPRKGASTERRGVLRGPLAQQRILEAVEELFYLEGARAVGVEAVAKRAGVNKMALYRQFESKDALLLQYLARMDEMFWGYFEASLAKHPGRPRQQVVQFFLDLTERAARPGFRGCPFVNIAGEFPDPMHPARRVVAATKARLLARLQALALTAGARDAKRLAAGLAFLIEGAYAASQTFARAENLMPSLPEVVEAIVQAELS